MPARYPLPPTPFRLPAEPAGAVPPSERAARRRAARLLDDALGQLARATAPLSVTLTPVGGEPVPWRAALTRPGQPHPVGDRWGPAWDSGLFRLRGAVPADWPLEDAVLVVDLGHVGASGFGAEGLAYDVATGRALGGLSPSHPWVRVPGRQIDVVVDAAANPVDWSGPSPEPDPGGRPLYRLVAAHLALLDRVVQRRVHDLRAAIQLGWHGLADWATVGTDPAALFSDESGRDGRVCAVAVGNAHIDTAWLWPYRETRRKLARTLATALALMERYPGYRFAVSQPQQLDWLRTDDPDLFARARAAADRGQLEPVGAMWVEADCNIPGGESLARQIIEGLRWWKNQFNAEPREVWLPDAFGYPAGLPGLMRHAGIARFVSQKLSWNETNVLPHHTFWWEGLGGARVLAHFPPADTYTGVVAVDELRRLQHNVATGADPPVALYLYGIGDGGGGPDEAMLEAVDRLGRSPALPALRHGSVAEFFDRLERALPADLPSWVGELYLEKHRGTYTTHAWLKRGMRRAESLLRDAELWTAAVPPPSDGPDRSADELPAAWRALLLQQFHDVLPGTSIGRVNREARQAVAEVSACVERAGQVAFEQLAELVDTSGCAEPVVVGDAGEAGRDDLLLLDRPVQGAQRTHSGRYAVLVRTPACGWATVDLSRPRQPGRPARAGPGVLDNGRLRVRFDAAGRLASVLDLARGRELLAGPGGVLQLLPDRPREWDAWDVDAAAMKGADDQLAAAEVQTVEEGPLRAAIRVRRPIGAGSRSSCVWSLTADARRLDLEVELDWFENQRLLKLAFPVAVHATAATYEVQWGQLVRPTHRNTPWDEARFEVCAHRWLDLSEPGFGVSLLNDGRYGHDVRRLPDGRGSVLRLSLLRAPLWPDPEVDRGRHELRVAIVPHDGEVWVARAEAAALNMPRRVVPLPARPGPLPATGTLVTADTPNVQVAAVKPAEDGPGTTAVRLFETVGSRTRVTLDGRLVAGRWCRADLLERPLGEWSTGPVTLELGPFEIATLLLAQGRSGGGARRAQGDPDLGWGGQAVVHRAV